ncbi:DDE-domain-containing protein [Dendrothele bispora CBS 962.96]|uniref:DDE-domain-containing protein n=1 Tax=Dendrothele bispora (strain CBS 962.96) TaxID=1314807 RepID=A0A4S8LHA1_DENBC|nr:DDE-domain-containing protein [Dendrothele bispora CBS 962.96]
MTSCKSIWLIDTGTLKLTVHSIATSPNGWTDDEIGFHWFSKTFVPQARARNTSGKPILLIYDGHVSHTRNNWVDFAYQNNVFLYCLPPHTTRRLQPLDVGCFSPLQNAWYRRCVIILNETGEGIELWYVVKEYMEARTSSFVEKTILKAWEKSEIRPLNPGIFKPSDFAPSQASSTFMHVLSSFPKRLPRAPDASSDDGMFDPAAYVDEHELLAESDGEDERNSDFDSHGEVEDGHDKNELIHSPHPHRPRSAQRTPWLDPALASDLSDSDNSDSDVDNSNSDLDNSDLDNEFSPTFSDHHSGSLDIPLLPYTPSPMPRKGYQTRSASRATHTSHSSSNSTTDEDTPFFLLNGPSLSARLYDAELENVRLRREVATLKADRDSANVHAVFAQREASILAYKLNKKKPTAKSRRIHTFALHLLAFSPPRKDVWRHRRRRPTQTSASFTGGLSTKGKADLGDIAASLDLPVNGTKEDIHSRIEEHFTANPELKENARYVGLFRRGRKRAPEADENSAPAQSSSLPLPSQPPTHGADLMIKLIQLLNILNPNLDHLIIMTLPLSLHLL